MSRMAAKHYALKPGARVRHPVYGDGTYLHHDYRGGIYTAAVRYDRAPLWTRGGDRRVCGCDMADLEVI